MGGGPNPGHGGHHGIIRLGNTEVTVANGAVTVVITLEDGSEKVTVISQATGEVLANS